MLKLRCKSKGGTQTVLGLTACSTLCELQTQLTQLTGIDSYRQRIKLGFPPTGLDLRDPSQTLQKLHINSGDTLIVEDDPSVAAQETNGPVHKILKRRVVPADNSCLFTSIGYVTDCDGGEVNPTRSRDLRGIIAKAVAADCDLYSEALLGKPNKEYCRWIMREDAWGGAIELSILSSHFNREICVADTQSLRIDRFGEGSGYKHRVLLIYDGIHYDPLELETDPGKPPQTTFSTCDDMVLILAQELAQEAHQRRQYTDLGRFTLRCLACQRGLTGQREAQQHAQETGHVNFGEV
uniref:Ubiquitin thioesterase OTU n=1 Tax=Eptatretus burgeri TaxID=7764 RepID=A0A8C4NJ42_EPTBU